MRKQLLERNAPPEWNVKVLTETDFWILCASARILVEEVPISRHGFRIERDRYSVIFVNNRLRGAERMFVLWHELAHVFLHPPGIQFFHGYNSQTEDEADTFAVCSMIPRPLLDHYWPSEIAELYGYPPDMVEFRRDIFDRWKL